MIAAALRAHALSSDRVWIGDRSQTVGASEIGQCARRTFFSKNEGDAVYGRARDADHEDGWGARARGTTYEDAWWVPALRATYGERLLYAGSEQRTLADEFLSATPDGLLVDMPADVLAHLGVPDIESDFLGVECKTADPRTRLDGPKDEHVYQVQVQLGLTRKLTNHQPVYGLITYTDASFWDEVREFPIRFDPAVFAAAQDRAREIMLARGPQDVRPEGVIAGGKECERCPFTAACGRTRADRVPNGKDAIDALMAETIADLALQARAARDAADASMNEARRIEEEVRALLAEAGTRRLDHGGVRVTWSPVKGRPSWDHKAIREAAIAAGVDVSKFERAGEPTDRLVITHSEVPAPAGNTAAEAA